MNFYSLKPLDSINKHPITLVIIVYTYLGGFKAVVWTDLFQSIIFIAGALFCIFFVFNALDWDIKRFFSITAEHKKFTFGTNFIGVTENSILVLLLLGFFSDIFDYGASQHAVQRYWAAKNIKEAKKAAIYCCGLYVPTAAIFFFVGTAIFVYYQAFPDKLLAFSGGNDGIVPYFVINELPHGLKSLIIIAILAAAMSTVDTCLHGAASVYTENVHHLIFRNDKNDHKNINQLHITSAIICCVSLTISYALRNVQFILDLWWEVVGIITGSLVSLIALEYLFPRLSKKQATVCILGGFFIILWSELSFLSPYFKSPFCSFWTPVLGIFITLLFGLYYAKKGTSSIAKVERQGL